MERADYEAYEVQLSQVEQALSADPTNEGLSSLRSELKELIELTRAALAQSEAAASSKSEHSRKASSQAVTTHAWSAGDECLAKYSGDGQWYPARIVSLGGSDAKRVYSIVFKGYNNTELVDASAVKPLSGSHSGPTLSGSGGSGASGGAGGKKRKMTKAEEEEREKKKKKNEKKVEVRAAKAKEQSEKQQTWQKFAKKAEKKGINIAGVSGTSIFKTPDNPMGKVGVTGSGKGMTPVSGQSKHKFTFTPTTD